VKQQHTSTATSTLKTKSTYRSLSAQRHSERTVLQHYITANVNRVGFTTVIKTAFFKCNILEQQNMYYDVFIKYTIEFGYNATKRT
jgi:hypothetical protein